MDTFYDEASDTMQQRTRRYTLARTIADDAPLDVDLLADDDDDTPWQTRGRDALTLTYPMPTHVMGVAGIRI